MKERNCSLRAEASILFQALLFKRGGTSGQSRFTLLTPFLPPLNVIPDFLHQGYTPACSPVVLGSEGLPLWHKDRGVSLPCLAARVTAPCICLAQG